MAHSVTIETLAAGLNQYQTVYGNRINSQLRTGLEFESELPFVQADYAYSGQDVTIGDLLQPYQVAFTPNNTETWDAPQYILQPIKADLEINAAQLEKFFSKWKPEWFNPDPNQQVNYFQLLFDEVILSKLTEELNLASWAGEYAAPTPGTPGAVLTSVDGFALAIADQITAGRLTPINIGAVDLSNAVEQVRDFCAQLPEPYRRKMGTLYMNTTYAQAYADDYFNRYQHRDPIVMQGEVEYFTVDHYNKRIKPMACMAGSDRIICAFDNMPGMVVGTRRGFAPYFEFRFEPEDRKLKLFSEIYRFYGFESTLHTFVSDQE